MNNNIKILVVDNKPEQGTDTLAEALTNLKLQNVVNVTTAGAAIKEFVSSNANNAYELTFIHDLPDAEENDLLKSIIEINPDHYVVILTDKITADKVLSSIKLGASGILSRPFSADKLRLELEKFSLLREDKKTLYS